MNGYGNFGFSIKKNKIWLIYILGGNWDQYSWMSAIDVLKSALKWLQLLATVSKSEMLIEKEMGFVYFKENKIPRCCNE